MLVYGCGYMGACVLCVVVGMGVCVLCVLVVIGVVCHAWMWVWVCVV